MRRKYRSLLIKLFVFINTIFVNYSKPKKYVYSPIFLLGLQSGGMTIISRLLQKHENVFIANFKFKSLFLPCELHNQKFSSLPNEFRLKNRNNFFNSDFGTETNKVYATNSYLNEFYHKPISKQSLNQFKNCIEKIYSAHGTSKRNRFIDKSQSFSLKTKYIRDLYPKSKFIIVYRNPYAWIARALKERDSHDRMNDNFSRSQLLNFYIEHYNNTYKYIHKNIKPGDCLVIKFENFIMDYKKNLEHILEYVHLSISKKYFESLEELSNYSNDLKWFPIQKEINFKHIKSLNDKEVKLIHSKIKFYTDIITYDKPEF